MPAAKTAAKKGPEISIPPLRGKTIDINLIGISGLYIHRMSAKAKQQLLVGGKKKTQAEKLAIKHQPYEEYKDCMYVDEDWYRDEEAGQVSHIRFPAMAVKGSMLTAALVTPGIKKTDIARLVFVRNEWIPIFGTPKLRMGIMRSSDINRTPDVRTRPYFEKWATKISITYSPLVLSERSIKTLLNNAGLCCGIGDERQEKGKGSAGMFEVVDEIPDDLVDWDAQLDAINNPVAYDLETQELLDHFHAEVEARK